MLALSVSFAMAAPEPCDQLDPNAAYVLTVAPGDKNENLFGHTALLLAPTGRVPMIYDWGHYSPGDWESIKAFIRGEPTYYLGATNLDRMLRKRAKDGRSVVAQRLELPQNAFDELTAQLDWMADGERQPFSYHWLHTNCTTELLDRIDDALGGELSTQHAEVGTRSAASEALMHAAKRPLTWFALHLGCGKVAHTEVSDWGARFMPQATYELLADSTLPGDSGPRPLVSETCVLFDAEHDMLEDRKAPNRDIWLFLLGMFAGVSVAGVAQVQRTIALAGVAAIGGFLGFWGFVVSFFGWFGTFAPVWEVHNLPFVSPLQWLLIPAAIGAWRRPGASWPMRVSLALLAFAAMGVLAAVGRGLADHNLGVVALSVSMLLGSTWALRRR